MLGILNYSNAIPLRGALASQYPLFEDTPQKLYQKIQAKELRTALTSSLHIEDPELVPVTEYCIASQKEILSVNLYHKCPLHALHGKKIAISNETATSFGLLKILCHHLWKCSPLFETLSSFSEIEHYDGALLIGDLALQHQRIEGFQTTDLSLAWYQLTGLPFVYALFFSHKKAPFCPTLQFKPDFTKIAKEASIAKKLPLSLITNYYQKITYHLGPLEKKGLQLFLQLNKGVSDDYLHQRKLAKC